MHTLVVKICTKVCPVKNITMEEKPKYNGNCQDCLACIHNCPQKVISLKTEKSAARFHNKDITLQEIIDSNTI